MPYDFDRVIDRRQTNSLKWTAYEADVLPMWVADMDFAVPEPITQALHEAVNHGIFGYEMPSKTLRATVTARMKKLYNWEIDESAVIATTGIVSAFYAAALALCAPGDGYLIQPPVYMPFNDIQKHQGVIRQEAQLAVAQTGRLRYSIDWNIFDKAFHTGGSRTKMFLLCNPHNPTGQVYSREELVRMAETCLKNGTVIVSDEIHSELLLGGAQHTPIATLAPEIAQQTITLIAPSKTFNTAGLFCGFALIPNSELRERFKAAIEKMTLHVASLAQVAAQVAFSGECDAWLDDLRAYLTANRDFLVDFVEKELPGIRVSRPDSTYLAWLDCNELVKNGKIQGKPSDFFLKNARLGFNDGSAFGTGGEGFVRLNFGCPRAMLEEGLERMKKALA